MAPVLPYTSKDTKYDNAKFRRRSTLKVNPTPCVIRKDRPLLDFGFCGLASGRRLGSRCLCLRLYAIVQIWKSPS
jgi:hypothetical protein